MKEKNQLPVVKNSLWCRIKNKIMHIFFKKRVLFQGENESEKANNNINSEQLNQADKKEFMKIYKKIKNQEISLEEINDEKTLYRIMLILQEEIDLTSKKIQDEMNDTAMHIYHLNMYNNKLNSLTKDS